MDDLPLELIGSISEYIPDYSYLWAMISKKWRNIGNNASSTGTIPVSSILVNVQLLEWAIDSGYEMTEKIWSNKAIVNAPCEVLKKIVSTSTPSTQAMYVLINKGDQELIRIARIMKFPWPFGAFEYIITHNNSMMNFFICDQMRSMEPHESKRKKIREYKRIAESVNNRIVIERLNDLEDSMCSMM